MDRPRRRIRWTEHGPEEVDDDAPDGDAPAGPAGAALGVDVTGSTDTAAAPTESGAPPSTGTDSTEVPAGDSPSIATRSTDIASAEATDTATTDTDVSGPIDTASAGTTEVATGEALSDDLEDVRRRLAERGLLRQEPSVRIRDVTDRPAKPAPEVSFAPEPATRSEVADDPADAAGLDAERVGPGSEVHCPKCRTAQAVATDASGFRCESCATVWRWAICPSCAVISLTMARQESWRCAGCGSATRSWWRTPTAPRDAELVRERRRDDAAAKRRAEAEERARRRRWKVLAAGATLILLTAIAAVVVTRRSSELAARGSGARTCDAFVASNLSTSADPVRVRSQLDELASLAAEAPDEIRIPAQRLAAAGRPGDPPFESARAALTAACR